MSGDHWTRFFETKTEFQANDGRQYLYHGTNLVCLASILDEDTLEAGGLWGRENEIHGPRLTRSSAIARNFIINSCYWSGGGILVLDAPALRRDFEVIEYLDVDTQGKYWEFHEEEEVVKTEQIKGLNRYLKAVLLEKDALDDAFRDWEDFSRMATDCGPDPFETHEAMKQALKSLYEDPRIIWVEGGMSLG